MSDEECMLVGVMIGLLLFAIALADGLILKMLGG